MADPLLPSHTSCVLGSGHNVIPPTGAPAQTAILDWFFPGFSMFAGVVQRYTNIDLNVYIPMLVLLGVLVVCWNYVTQYLWEKVESYFMSVVDIRTDDEIYNMIMAWVASQRFSLGARNFIVNTNLSSRSWNMWRYYDDSDDEDDDDEDRYSSEKKKKKALSYTPSFGSHYFWYRGRLLMFRRSSNREQHSSSRLVSEREEISIACLGRNPWILKELLLEAREKYNQKDQQKTQIYRGTMTGFSSEPSWQRCMSRATRPFSTVILDEKTKNNLIADVTDYLNPATQRWYANRGIPYRRGYLLHGPPGTGKSSLSLALAGFFKMRIYIVSLSSVSASEETLGNLFAALPRRCVVLLEDIDSAGLTHTREVGGGPSNPPPVAKDDEEMEPGQITPGNGGDSANGRLSLSGLLNILDGVASQEGRILIMTTNHIDKLDKALIRPGRVDMTVEFGLADEYMTTNIFRNIFASLEGDDGPMSERYVGLNTIEREAAMENAAKKRAARDAYTSELAQAFAAKIPTHEFSPAELQGHLMKYKRDPQGAIDAADEFIERTRRDHKEKELKKAEEKRKAEQEAAEKKKKDAKEEAEKKAKEAIEKKVEEEIRKQFGEEIRKKVEAEVEKKKKKKKKDEELSEKKKTSDGEDGASPSKADDDKSKTTTETDSDPTSTAVAETNALSLSSSDLTSEKGVGEKQPGPDSGYVTPATSEP